MKLNCKINRCCKALRAGLSVFFLTILVSLLLTLFPSRVAAADDSVELRVYNWGEYISNGEDGTLDVLEEFENRFPNIKLQ